MTYKETPGHAVLRAILETVQRVLHVPELLEIAREVEPCGVVPRPRRLVALRERVFRIVRDVLRERTARLARRAEVDGFCDVSRHEVLRRFLAAPEFQEHRNGGVDKALQFWVGDARGSARRWLS